MEALEARRAQAASAALEDETATRQLADPANENIAVYWAGDRAYFPGAIVERRQGSNDSDNGWNEVGTADWAQVRYYDKELQWEDLGEVPWRHVALKAKRPTPEYMDLIDVLRSDHERRDCTVWRRARCVHTEANCTVTLTPLMSHP